MEEERPRKLEGGPRGFGAVAMLSAKWIDAFKIVDQRLQEGSLFYDYLFLKKFRFQAPQQQLAALRQ